MKVTINIQDELYVRLQQLVSSGDIDQFILDAIEQELESKELALIKAYEEMYRDSDRNNLISDWDDIK